MVRRWQYFSAKEVEGLDEYFVDWLDAARALAKTPFILTSGKRTKKKNMGAKNSSHLRGLGVDIRCANSKTRYKILDAVLDAGATRIGIYTRHIHVDVDNSLPQGVIWTGRSL